MKWWPRAGSVLLAAVLSSGCAATMVPSHPSALQGHVRKMNDALGLNSIVGIINGLTLSLGSVCVQIADPGRASCMSRTRHVASTTSAYPDSVYGLTPSDLSSIYGYPAPAAQAATNQVVAVVVAYDYANAESDLGVYRNYYRLPACTKANGCFVKVGAAAPYATPYAVTRQSISANPTTTASGWAAETAADIETVSAVCANCKIVLAEASSDSLTDLASAVTAAVHAGATVINLSFGAVEDSSQLNLVSQFTPAGVKVVAATGDNGPAALFPADLANVIAVAGTTVSASGPYVSESLWSGSGGGCSRQFGRASYQPYRCGGMRAIADVAAVADPNSGIADYDSAQSGWGIVGGTSVAAPVIAAMYALSGRSANGTGSQPFYANPNAFTTLPSDSGFGGLGTPNNLSGF